MAISSRILLNAIIIFKDKRRTSIRLSTAMFRGTPCTFSAFKLNLISKYYLDKNQRRSSFYCFMRFS